MTKDTTGTTMGTADSTAPGGLRPWHLFFVAGLAASTAAVALARDTRPVNLVMISLTALAAVAVAVTAHMALAPFGEDAAEDNAPMLSARARAALEREKMLVLRSIKELEFDRAMGKIADADFADMVGRLRARAISVMQQLDTQGAGYRGLIERDLAEKLASLGHAPTPPSNAETPPPATTRPAVQACAKCGTSNDHDARFCKSCGARLDAHAVSM